VGEEFLVLLPLFNLAWEFLEIVHAEMDLTHHFFCEFLPEDHFEVLLLGTRFLPSIAWFGNVRLIDVDWSESLPSTQYHRLFDRVAFIIYILLFLSLYFFKQVVLGGNLLQIWNIILLGVRFGCRHSKILVGHVGLVRSLRLERLQV